MDAAAAAAAAAVSTRASTNRGGRFTWYKDGYCAWRWETLALRFLARIKPDLTVIELG